jgi:Lar family restriction alleviation protein
MTERKITTVGGLEMFRWGNSHLYRVEGLALLPCPFCGDEAGFRKDKQRHHPPEFPYAVECSQTSCGVRTPFHYKTEAAAAEAWNRRITR